jgi:hypothetical protein
MVTSSHKVFLVDPLAAKDFHECQYIPKQITAYIPPEFCDEKGNYNHNGSYREDFTKTHDLYALSALFVKVLSNTDERDSCNRDNARMWPSWKSNIGDIENLKRE